MINFIALFTLEKYFSYIRRFIELNILGVKKQTVRKHINTKTKTVYKY
jgi:hypothetical protein